VKRAGSDPLRTAPSVLAVTVAAGLCLLAPAASPAASPDTATARPQAAAGWHGRAIQRPKAADPERARATGRPVEGVRVERIQRMLRRLGYAAGPVDGILGPRTRASVQWFQIKHGLPPSGVVDALTLRRLQGRTASAPLLAVPVTGGTTRRPAARPVPAVHPAPAARPAPAVPADTDDPSGGPLPIFAALLAVLALAGAALLAARNRRRGRSAPGVPRVTPARAPTAPQPVASPLAAVGFAAGRDAADRDRQKRTIARVCADRGWGLACVVGDPARSGDGRPPIASALEQVVRTRARRLVVARLGRLVRARSELAALLTWCARHDVELVALDVGLDTGTHEGRAVARNLLGSPDRRPAARRRTNGRARGASLTAARSAPSSHPDGRG
jgi:peptidoglycan hydrolase-like protein with peptidoglycan-binding domain